jgi:hypothetical protein
MRFILVWEVTVVVRPTSIFNVSACFEQVVISFMLFIGFYNKYHQRTALISGDQPSACSFSLMSVCVLKFIYL